MRRRGCEVLVGEQALFSRLRQHRREENLGSSPFNSWLQLFPDTN